jgi:hypothetical protein
MRMRRARAPRCRHRALGPPPRCRTPLFSGGARVSTPRTMLPCLLFAAVVAALPQASAEQVFSVFNFGARGDGKHNDTAAIQAALDRAAAAGGGVAHLPANGTFLTGGGLNALGHAYDGVTLRVDGAVTIPGPAAKPLWSTPAQCGTAEHVKGSGGKGTDPRRRALPCIHISCPRPVRSTNFALW